MKIPWSWYRESPVTQLCQVGPRWGSWRPSLGLWRRRVRVLMDPQRPLGATGRRRAPFGSTLLAKALS